MPRGVKSDSKSLISGDRLVLDPSSPIIKESRADAEEVRRTTAAALASRLSYNLPPVVASTDRKKFERAPGTSGGHEKKEVD